MMWSWTQFGSDKQQKFDVLNKLDILLKSISLTSKESFLKMSTLNELERIQYLEETMWSQRSHPLLLKQGDHNSKFFHVLIRALPSLSLIHI